MKSETKVCQNCKQDFTIEPEDFNFYEKIKVPPPTWCPECRRRRRFLLTNETVLYKRKCDLTGKDIFSMYPADSSFVVYDTDVWYSDKWDPYSYGVDFDESKPFLEQFFELQNKVPKMSLVKQGMSINSPYAHRVTDPKNSYMTFRASYPENCMYVYNAKYTKDSPDSVGVFRITQNELNFYRKMDLPLPRVCFNIRHFLRMKKRPLLRILKRKCTKCNIDVDTIYDEDHALVLYCKKYYQQEVY